MRGASYFLIAYMLLSINSYGISWPGYLALSIGLLGAGSSSARVAQIAIAVLLFMAVLPIGVIEALKSAIG
ncbi:hypothetical protein [Rhizobium leucaenae]|uniref:hypothetical protein n=1 Tax=Rhizobium leucaenae TaxID=29450 RepID=UPI0007EE7318|nr:hypothetical protein [Rhizobium leucaenae]